MNYLQYYYPSAGSTTIIDANHSITTSCTLENPALAIAENLQKKKVRFADEQHPRCIIKSGNEHEFYFTGDRNKKFEIQAFDSSGKIHTLKLGDQEKGPSQVSTTTNTENNSASISSACKSIIKTDNKTIKYNYHKEIIKVIQVKSTYGNILIGKNTEANNEIVVESYEQPTIDYGVLSLTGNSNDITIFLPDDFSTNKEIFLFSKHGSISTDSSYIFKNLGKIETHNSDITLQIDNSYIYPHLKIESGDSKIRGRVINSVDTKKLLLISKKGNLSLDVFSNGKQSLATVEKKQNYYA